MAFYAHYDQHLSASELALGDRARAFCCSGFAAAVQNAFRRAEPVSAEWFSKWADLGFLGLQVKAEHGGLAASFMCKIRVAQEMARHSFAVAFCWNHHQGSATRLSRMGSAEQQQHLLAAMLSGNVIATTAITAAGGSSDRLRDWSVRKWRRVPKPATPRSTMLVATRRCSYRPSIVSATKR